VLKRFLARQVLLVLTVVGVCAQTPTIFPSDSKDPKLAGGAVLLQAVCPDAVSEGKEIGCAVKCPEFTGFPGEPFSWSVWSVNFGHFLSPTSEDAALAMLGCEPHSRNAGGTILLTKRSGDWQMLWYKAGVDTAMCHKVSLPDRREILVCFGSGGEQGYMTTSVSVEDLLSPRLALMADENNNASFFSAPDDTGTCGWPDDVDERGGKTITSRQVERVEFSLDEKHTPLISITAATGKKRMTRADVDACVHLRTKPVVPGRKYRMVFKFNGNTFEPTPASLAAVKLFNEQ
jgi:hypothetical protein